MQSVCTAIPLKPGAWEMIRKYRDELVNQLDHADVAYARERRGLQVVKIFHQVKPIDALILYFEADDLEEAFHPRHRENEAGAKMADFWRRVGGLEDRFLAEFPQLLIDWHHEDGHLHKAEVVAPTR